MNPWQVTQQILAILAGIVWPDSPGDPLFGRVGATPIDPSFFNLDARLPWAMVVPGEVRYQEEHPEVVEEARWQVVIYAGVANDQSGRSSILGANRSSLGKSAGRGLLELEPLVVAYLKSQTVGLGVRSVATLDTRAEARDVPGLVASRPIEIVGRRPLQTALGFAPVTRARGVGSAGSVTLSWRLPGVSPTYRWDLVGLTVRRAAGATPPATPSAGTNVPVSGVTSGVVDSPGAGTWSYSIFATYDEGRDPITGVQPSSPLTQYAAAATVAGVVA